MGPRNNMGELIWSLESEIDFPPLHIDTGYQEDMIGERYSFIEDESYSSEVSFQEALTREKGHSEKTNDVLNMVALRKEDNRYQSPIKKVSQENSGWWSLTNTSVTPVNEKNKKDVINKMLELSLNKSNKCLWSINYPQNSISSFI